MDSLDVARAVIAERYISGKGIEIGAFGRPVRLPPTATVRYVDKNPVETVLRQHGMDENASCPRQDILEDGFVLASIPDESLDFIIACHVLEHAEDVIAAVECHLGKLKPSGVLYYILPDKCSMFDSPRPQTTFSHLLLDNGDGGRNSREMHIREWCDVVFPGFDESKVRAEPEQIHFHAWSYADQVNLFLNLQGYLDGFEILLCERIGTYPEVVTVLRKA